MKIGVLCWDWKESLDSDLMTDMIKKAGPYINTFDNMASDDKMMFISSDKLTKDDLNNLYEAGDLLLCDEIWEGKDVKSIIKSIEEYVEKEDNVLEEKEKMD